MVIARQRESNLLKYNVAGDCLAIKLWQSLGSLVIANKKENFVSI